MTRLRALLLTLAASGAALAAGDPQASPPGSAASGPAPVPAQSPAAPAPAPAQPAPAARDIEDFVPTEKVSADDAVAFPTDI